LGKTAGNKYSIKEKKILRDKWLGTKPITQKSKTVIPPNMRTKEPANKVIIIKAPEILNKETKEQLHSEVKNADESDYISVKNERLLEANKRLAKELEDYKKDSADMMKLLEECKENLLDENKRLRLENANLIEKNNKLASENKAIKTNDPEYLKEIKAEYDNELNEVKNNTLTEMKKMQEVHGRIIKLLETDKEEALKLERESFNKEREQLKQLHQIDIENIKRQYEQMLIALRRQLEFEDGIVKNRLVQESELNKLTTHVDSLSSTMQAKVDTEYKNKLQHLHDQQSTLEENKRMQILEKRRFDMDKKHLAEAEKSLREKQKQINKEIEMREKIYKCKIDSSEEQYKELLKEINEKQEKIMMERQEIELEKEELRRAKKAWERELLNTQTTVTLDKKALEKQKEEFNKQIEEDTNNLNIKLSELREKSEEISKGGMELRVKEQELVEKQIQLKREYDEYQLKVDKYCYDRRQLEIEKLKVEKTAAEVEEKSKIIRHYKSITDEREKQLEDIELNIETKESTLRQVKANLEVSQKEISLKQEALQRVHLNSLKDCTLSLLNGAMTTRCPSIPKSSQAKYKPEVVKHKYSSSAFNANKFIEELENVVDRKESFTKYIMNERNLLIKAKQNRSERSNQSTIFSAHNGFQSAKKG